MIASEVNRSILLRFQRMLLFYSNQQQQQKWFYSSTYVDLADAFIQSDSRSAIEAVLFTDGKMCW